MGAEGRTRGAFYRQNDASILQSSQASPDGSDGARFSDRVAGDRERFGEQAKIVQLDIDEKEINKNVKVDEYILGDIKEILIALTIGLDRQNHPDWLSIILLNCATHI